MRIEKCKIPFYVIGDAIELKDGMCGIIIREMNHYDFGQMYAIKNDNTVHWFSHNNIVRKLTDQEKLALSVLES